MLTEGYSHTTHTPENTTDWSDSQRMQAFVETYDPQYLTIALAREMRVTPEIMQDVVGASETDIADAEAWHAASETAVKNEIDNLLKPYGADYESLAEKSIHEQLRSLLDAATIRVVDSRTDEGFDQETIHDE